MQFCETCKRQNALKMHFVCIAKRVTVNGVNSNSAILRMARVNSNYLPKVRLAGKIEEMKWKKTDCTEGKEAFEASTF